MAPTLLNSVEEIRMQMTCAVIVLTASLSACAQSIPAPSNKLALAEGGARRAAELGAYAVPDAALHLKMANDQITSAKIDIAFGDNQEADRVLSRATADVELALQLAKEATARRVADDAQTKLRMGKRD